MIKLRHCEYPIPRVDYRTPEMKPPGDVTEMAAQGRFYEIAQNRRLFNRLPLFNSTEEAREKLGARYREVTVTL